MIDFKEYEWPAMQNATPPIEALPLLALIAQFNYSEEKHAQDFYDHLPR